MQSSYWGYWLVVFGVAIVGLMISVNGITSTSTQDYYSIKEITEASMLTAVDYGYYREYNEVKINKEKFMEVFIRMLAENMGKNDVHELSFYDIYEAPPKVSVQVRSNSGTNFINTNTYDTTTRIDAIVQIYAEGAGAGYTPPSETVSFAEGTNIQSYVNSRGNVDNITLNVNNASGAICNWTTSNPDNISLSSSTGESVTLTFKKRESATIKVKCGDKESSFTITPPPKYLSINNPALSDNGTSWTKTVSITDSVYGATCNWTSTNSNVSFSPAQGTTTTISIPKDKYADATSIKVNVNCGSSGTGELSIK